MKNTKNNISENWNKIKRKMKQQYAQLTDDDLAYVDGNEDELLGRLETKIGKSRSEIAAFMIAVAAYG